MDSTGDQAEHSAVQPGRNVSQANTARTKTNVCEPTIETGDDFIDSKQLRASFPRPHLVEHHYTFSDAREGIRQQRRVEVWERKKELGRGGFGTVVLEAEKGGRLRAVKQIPKSVSGVTTANHLREILAMAKLSVDSAYFISLYGWYQGPEHIHIAMEYAPLGDLASCVTGPLPNKQAQSICQQVAQALNIMHSKKFCHRDLTPKNIFVVQNSPEWWVKIGDFGMSKRVRDEQTSFHTTISNAFAAPEMLGMAPEDTEGTYTNAVDMWALGCLIHWLLTYSSPMGRGQLYPYFLGKKPLSRDAMVRAGVSEDVQLLVQKLLAPIPKDRITSDDVISSGWLYDATDELVLTPEAELTERKPLRTVKEGSVSAIVEGNALSKTSRAFGALAYSRGPPKPIEIPSRSAEANPKPLTDEYSLYHSTENSNVERKPLAPSLPPEVNSRWPKGPAYSGDQWTSPRPAFDLGNATYKETTSTAMAGSTDRLKSNASQPALSNNVRTKLTVDHLSPNKRLKDPAKTPGQVIKALHDYEAQTILQLSFRKGDILVVLSHEDNNEWYRACNAFDPAIRGLVPVELFEIIDEQFRLDEPLNLLSTVHKAKLNPPDLRSQRRTNSRQSTQAANTTAFDENRRAQLQTASPARRQGLSEPSLGPGKIYNPVSGGTTTAPLLYGHLRAAPELNSEDLETWRNRFHSENPDSDNADLGSKKTGSGSFVNSLLGTPKRLKISAPEDPRHIIHVTYDRRTKEYSGLPKGWRRLLSEVGVLKEEPDRNHVLASYTPLDSSDEKLTVPSFLPFKR